MSLFFKFLAECDVNQSGGTNPTCNDITISDIQILVNQLFISGAQFMVGCEWGVGTIGLTETKVRIYIPVGSHGDRGHIT